MPATIPAHSAHAPSFTPAPPRMPPVPPDPASRDHHWADRWPLRSYLELAALDTAPGSARAHACAVLHEWKLDAISDESALVVSELVTNAVFFTQEHGFPDPIRLWMLGSSASAVVLVWDATLPPPVLRVITPDADPEIEHGRGLAIVSALSARWGYYHPAESPGGKVVYALVAAS